MTPSCRSPISDNAATALETTVALLSSIKSLSISTNPPFSARLGSALYNFATHIAAVLRTYGSLSFKQCRRFSVRASVTTGIVIYDMVRIANARMRGFRSLQSCVISENKRRDLRIRTNLQEVWDNKVYLVWFRSSVTDKE